MIWIIDFESPTVHYISKKLAQLGYKSIILSVNEALEALLPLSSLDSNDLPDAIILSGGPNHIYNDNTDYSSIFHYSNLPILGICYGMQVITQTLGGKVVPCDMAEHGIKTIIKNPRFNLVSGYFNKNKYITYMNHEDCISDMPNNFYPMFYTHINHKPIIAGIMSLTRPIVGYQFHPEAPEIDNNEFFLFFLKFVAKLTPGIE